MISYDPDEAPNIDPEAHERADAAGLHMIHVVCDEPGAKVGDAAGVSFVSYGHFLPREGEIIKLEDGKRCRVRNILYKLGRPGDGKLLMIVPNVMAVHIDDANDER